MRILIIDADPGAQRVIAQMLHAVPDLELFTERTAHDAIAHASLVPPDLMLIDADLGGQLDGGIDLLRRSRQNGWGGAAIMIASYESFTAAREALRLGAQDYVVRDTLTPELLTSLVEAQRERLAFERPRERNKRPTLPSMPTAPMTAPAQSGASALLGSSPAMVAVRRIIAQVAGASSPVLIIGETGTGKELVARALHDASPRRSEPFVAVNCSALPGALIESLIFGHEKGAFTGAESRRRGQLELARGGTILLDEIGDMPIELQAKLLRVLEERRFRPVGSETEIPVRARVLAATHTDLAARIADGRFREDLFYRLDVVTIALPALADREDDVLELLEAFTAGSGRRLRFTDEALSLLRHRHWRGNVRELRNLVERIVLLAEDDRIDVPTLEPLLGGLSKRAEHSGIDVERIADWFLDDPGSFAPRFHLVEHVILRRALDRCGGNRSAAARLLGMDRKLLERRLERLATDASQNTSTIRRIPTTG